MLQETTTQLETLWNDLPFADVITIAQATCYVMTIYYHNDMSKAIGQDLVIGEEAISWIANGHRMVCFINRRRSWANSDTDAICMYEDLPTDIANIIYLMGVTFQSAIEAI